MRDGKVGGAKAGGTARDAPARLGPTRFGIRSAAVGAVLLGFVAGTGPTVHAQASPPAVSSGRDGATVGPGAGAPTEVATGRAGWSERLDGAFARYLVAPLASVIMFDLIVWDDPVDGHKLPLIVAWLILGAAFFTLRMRFISVRGVRHAAEIAIGRYDSPDEEGEVTHFQALSSALSATVGLGNIAGVAIAVSVGGPGAVFWMVMAGFLGMSSKFTECTLAQMYRHVDEHGRVLGGPMRYLREGLRGRGWPKLGAVLSTLFCMMCIGGSLGGGNMFQANQAYAQAARVLPWLRGNALLFGLVLALLVAVVIIGGIRRIGRVAERIVPLMCGVYVLAGVMILLIHYADVPRAAAEIVGRAFSPEAGLGGALGVLVTGFQRAAFSNEAGVGSASIAHSAAATNEPVREGLVALLEPLIDTVFICTMTGLVVVVTEAYRMVPAEGDSTMQGVIMTSNAYETAFSWFPYVLAVAVFLFAFSTMISWSYYGERCWAYLFGSQTSIVYKLIFVSFVVLGSVLKLGSVVDFADLMILGMALPNIFGLLLLNAQVSNALHDYWSRYRSGQIQRPSERVVVPASAVAGIGAGVGQAGAPKPLDASVDGQP